MRANPKTERSLKRLARLALCIGVAALLSACETYQDARSDYHDMYHDAAPGREYREARAPRPHYTSDTRVAVRDDIDITPRHRPIYQPAPHIAPVTPSDTRVGDNLAAGFVSPISGRVVAAFGSTGGGERNDGINIAAASGTPFRAAAGGTVTYAGNELKGYGNLILIEHAGGYVTAYAHANSIGVERGQHVARGDVIGTVGQTGNVDQPQLHFEIRLNMKPIDPKPMLTASRD
jgi:murein DD-endopeptidase MepM/ murein hydrolase activator NlpD